MRWHVQATLSVPVTTPFYSLTVSTTPTFPPRISVFRFACQF